MSMNKTIRGQLFSGFKPCASKDCLVGGGVGGLQTNGTCECLLSFSREQLYVLSARLRLICDKSDRSKALDESLRGKKPLI